MKIKLRSQVKFLAALFSGIGTSIRRDGLASYVDLDYTKFSPLTVAGTAHDLIAVYNDQTLRWGTTSLTTLGGSVSFSDISGAISASQIPANVITNAMSATMAAKTIKANPTSGAANASDITISGLTDITTPSPTLDWLMVENHTTGTLEKTNASELLAGISAGVISIGGAAGVLSTVGGLAVSGTQLFPFVFPASSSL
jgi:hypothetical protein